MTEKNDFVVGLLVEQFFLYMMVSQRFKESPKTFEGLPVLLTVLIPEKGKTRRTEVAWKT